MCSESYKPNKKKETRTQFCILQESNMSRLVAPETSPEKHRPGFQWDSRQGSRWDPTLRQRIEVQIAFKQQKRGEKTWVSRFLFVMVSYFQDGKLCLFSKKLAQLFWVKGLKRLLRLLSFRRGLKQAHVWKSLKIVTYAWLGFGHYFGASLGGQCPLLLSSLSA